MLLRYLYSHNNLCGMYIYVLYVWETAAEVSEQNSEVALSSPLKLSSLDPRLEAPPPDDLGGELRWDWILGYYTRIILIQHIYIHICFVAGSFLETECV